MPPSSISVCSSPYHPSTLLRIQTYSALATSSGNPGARLHYVLNVDSEVGRQRAGRAHRRASGKAKQSESQSDAFMPSTERTRRRLCSTVVSNDVINRESAIEHQGTHTSVALHSNSDATQVELVQARRWAPSMRSPRVCAGLAGLDRDCGEEGDIWLVNRRSKCAGY